MFLANSSGAIDRHRICQNAARCVLYNFCARQILKSVGLLFVLLILSMIANSTSAIEASEDVRNSEESFEGRKGAAIGVVNNSIQNNETTDTNIENDNEKDPSEIQKAVCTVTAGEVKASAEAVTTKTLKGVCGSNEMHAALEKLEIKLLEELNAIRKLLQQHINNKIVQVENEIKEQIQPGHQSVTVTTTTTEMPTKQDSTSNKLKNSAYLETNTNPAANSINDFYARQSGITPKMKSLPRQMHSSVREQEVTKFNNTMLSDRDLKVFTYYWKLENFSDHIRSAESNTVESPIFSIKGKPLHIKAFFNHLHRDFLYLQIEYATLNTNNNRNNIILDTGGLFKEIANDKVLFKHKISILDQNNQRSNDLVSQEFNNLEMGFSIPNSALLSSPYVKKNSILIQVFLYL